MPQTPGSIQTVAEFSGELYVPIATAVSEARRLQRPLKQRDLIVVTRSDRAFLITFVDRDPPGDHEVEIAFAVELSTAGLDVIRAGETRGDLTGAPLLARIDARYYGLLTHAVALFQAKGLRLADYRIALLRDGRAVVVAFNGNDTVPGERGSLSINPGFEVEFDGRSLEPVKSRFIR